jgi:glycosyltransferase involved in cell wall biosynthesis
MKKVDDPTTTTTKGSIAVVIPLYNKATWIRQTLESVLNQLLAPDEIIVVDDGSTDEGPSIVEAVGGERVRLMRTQRPRGGPSTARNVGIRAAHSEWIALLDADDLWSPKYLSTIGEFMERWPGVGSIFTTRVVAGARVSFEHPPRENNASERALDLHSYLDLWIKTGRRGLSPMHSSSSVIRKAVLEQAGSFPEDSRRGEDKDTWLRVVATADALHIPQALVSYRRDLPGQLNDGTVATPPPVAFTAARLSHSPKLPSKVKAQLRQLANQELWLYAKRRRLRPFDKAALGAFDKHRDPIRFLAMAGLFGLGAARGRVDKLMRARP